MFKRGDIVKVIKARYPHEDGDIGTIEKVRTINGRCVEVDVYVERANDTEDYELDRIKKIDNVIVPCPFKSSPLRHEPFIQTTSTGLYKIQCTCGASGPMAVEEQEAIDNWNGR